MLTSSMQSEPQLPGQGCTRVLGLKQAKEVQQGLLLPYLCSQGGFGAECFLAKDFSPMSFPSFFLSPLQAGKKEMDQKAK